MGNIIKLSSILFFVAGIAAGSLAFYNSFTKPEIAKLKAENETKARGYVLQGLIPDDQIPGLIYEEGQIEINGMKEKFWKVKTPGSNQYKALVFLAKGQGFSGVVETMVATDMNFKINGIKVLKHTETPGLGAEAQTVKYGDTKPFFEGWFKEKNSLNVIVEKDDPNSADKVQSITGATITTRAVCNSINKYAELVKKQMGAVQGQIVIDQSKVVSVDREAIMKARAEAAAKAEAEKDTTVTEDTPEGGKDE
ncbi:MAG: FMN-binding protein [Candidatus Delongbacteria bacterium]|nr:FMN-binding protein [Candidatus Delongbacteria bacterium]